MSPSQAALSKRAKAPRLGLNEDERRALRAARLTMGSIADLTGAALHRELDGSVARKRCDEIAALADFQRLGSVGLEMARDFVQLGFRSVSELPGQDPRELCARLSKITRSHQDPCVEDTFRCAIAQAENPELPARLRDWWQWTSVRGKPMNARP
ncbi:MAG: Pathogenicity locus [Planctomycetes bacterium]|nr:Pathogenicity locus [Planctomycetota bacterium]